VGGEVGVGAGGEVGEGVGFGVGVVFGVVWRCSSGGLPVMI
jgi:hypothetical protein